MPRITPATLLALSLFCSGGAGCDFFQELESAESGEDGDTGSLPDRADGSCGLTDDYCSNQDRGQICDFETGETGKLDCGLWCGAYTNFTCTAIASGQHGCWCVEPGTQKIDDCGQLEQCLADCGAGVSGACGNACFGRTTAGTIRLYGALVYCAESECETICTDNPQSCASCVASAKLGLYGSCGVERSVCDNDDNDEPDWP